MIQPNFSQLLAVYAGLIAFGFAYNHLIALAARRGWIEGYAALVVIVGILVILGALALVDGASALVALGAFAAAGAPIAAGSIWRHLQAREKAQRSLIEDIDE